ncbi:hypothetical protein [Micromonospora fulviviridis]|uniref:Uncharacterized protein n=1 Tax=Micromonospora fulviviridis TaxID=47860 RepID=A0ABV2VN64_9ACTN
MENGEPVVMQVYCRVEVLIDDPDAVGALAVQRLRNADIDWPSEPDTIEEAAAELRTDLPQALGSLVDPDGLLAAVSGVRVRRGRWWVEPGEASPRFQPGFID